MADDASCRHAADEGRHGFALPPLIDTSTLLDFPPVVDWRSASPPIPALNDEAACQAYMEWHRQWMETFNRDSAAFWGMEHAPWLPDFLELPFWPYDEKPADDIIQDEAESTPMHPNPAAYNPYEPMQPMPAQPMQPMPVQQAADASTADAADASRLLQQAAPAAADTSTAASSSGGPPAPTTPPAARVIGGNLRRGSGVLRASGRYGERGGKRNPNVQWHSGLAVATREGWAREYREMYPKPTSKVVVSLD